MTVSSGVVKPALLISALLAALTFLFVKTRTLNVNEQNHAIIKIQDLIYQDALVNESVLESQAGRFANYDPLTKYKIDIADHLRWFKRKDSGIYGVYGRDLDSAIEDTEAYFKEKMSLVERFKSHNGLFKNSMHYLPIAIKEVSGDANNARHQSDLDALLTQILLFNYSLDDQNRINASNLITRLKNDDNQQIAPLILHAETVIREQLKLQEYVNQLFSIPTKQGIDRIYQLYSRYSAEKLDWASTYRTAMYAMAIVLLFYVSHLLLSLGKTMRCLKDSLDELAFQKHALDEHAIVAIMDADETIIYVNERFTHISQYSKQEIVGKGLSGINPENNPMPFFTQFRETLVDGNSWKGETFSQRKDGSHYWVEATIVPFVDKANKPVRYVALLTDITARKTAEAEQEIVQSELQMAASVFSDSPMAIMISDFRGSILRVNDAFSTITGFSLEEAIGQSVRILQSDYNEHHFASKMWKALANSGQWEGEIMCSRKDGSTYPVWSNITAIYDSLGDASHYINSFSDISEKKIIEDRIFYLAHYDALTDLPNRAYFLQTVEKARAQCAGSGSKIAILFLDLDNFKMVNDSMGHARGDTLLKNVASVLRSAVRQSDIVARLGGDEFIIALLDIQSAHNVERICQKISDLTKQALSFGEKEILVSTSIGVSIFPDDATSVETLIKNADTAMYHAKSNGKGKYQLFCESMNIAGAQQLDLTNDLRLAINNQQFDVHYQPQIIAQTGEIFAVEALIRWNHPLHGNIPPDNFIADLESSGLIIDVGNWVLQKAVSQLAVWKSSGYCVRMAVNISSRQLENDHLPKYVRQLLDSYSIDPAELELELTETSLMKNPAYAIAQLTELSHIGINLALDDFGTGYSSLSCLKHIPIKTLKIDQSFVQDISTDDNDKVIAAAIIAMAKSLGLKVTGKGVESAEQFEILLRSECDYVQGFHFGEPVSADDIEQLLSATATGSVRYAQR